MGTAPLASLAEEERGSASVELGVLNPGRVVFAGMDLGETAGDDVVDVEGEGWEVM